MILIADSGSTKTEWIIIDQGVAGKPIFSSGLNPFFLNSGDIILLLKKEAEVLENKSFGKAFFYGSGCNSLAKNNIIREALRRFIRCDDIFVGSDLLGAARSLCQDKPGIACIMGTGSNSCYYNGSEIISNVAPLGYILGDEGGGASLGKKLITGILKKHLSQGIIDRFFETYQYTPPEILDNVYMKPFPNRFLGQFARFISSNMHEPELQDIVVSSFDDFIKKNILKYPESETQLIHFTGSIAFHFRSYLEETLKMNDLRPGEITLSPMKDLINFHLSNL